jgi:hypothetical protein
VTIKDPYLVHHKMRRGPKWWFNSQSHFLLANKYTNEGPVGVDGSPERKAVRLGTRRNLSRWGGNRNGQGTPATSRLAQTETKRGGTSGVGIGKGESPEVAYVAISHAGALLVVFGACKSACLVCSTSQEPIRC